MSDSKVLNSMRIAFWNQAKGFLMSMLHTFYGDSDVHKEVSKLTEDYIKEVDNWIE